MGCTRAVKQRGNVTPVITKSFLGWLLRRRRDLRSIGFWLIKARDQSWKCFQGPNSALPHLI